LLIFVEKRQES